MLNYLHYLLQQEESSLLHRFLYASIKNPRKGDWVENINNILEGANITHTFDEIKLMKKPYFSRLIQNKIRKVAFQNLLERQKELENGSKIEYSSFCMQDYLLGTSPLSLEHKRLLFSLRIDSRNDTAGFGQTSCLLPCSQELTNEHIYTCNTYNNGETHETPYNKIYNGVLMEKVRITKIMENIIKSKRLVKAT